MLGHQRIPVIYTLSAMDRRIVSLRISLYVYLGDDHRRRDSDELSWRVSRALPAHEDSQRTHSKSCLAHLLDPVDAREKLHLDPHVIAGGGC